MVSDPQQRYQLVERIGQGGMAVVHRAHDTVLERTVALKVLHPHLAERADSRARFSREAKAVARLKHPHIVEVFDYASADSDQSFIVTEFINGPTLREFADELSFKHAETAILLMMPVVDALAKAHLVGIIHRDVKPENIMLRKDGSPVLMDFGIAQMVDMPTLTATGTMLGSPAHMAPEVIDGTDIGAAADIFSVGTTLYWLVTGTLPFVGPNPSALFRRILETQYDPVLQRRPHAGRATARLIERCLSKDQSLRPSAAELREDMKAILKGTGLGQTRDELMSLVSDPQVYEQRLTARLIPHIVAQAEEAYGEKNVALAIDNLDRVLGLEPDNQKALALIKRIERSRLIQRNLLVAAVLCCGLMPMAIGLWYFTRGDTKPTVTTTQQGGMVDGVAILMGDADTAGASTATAKVQDSGPAGRPLDSALKEAGDAQLADLDRLDSAIPLDAEERALRTPKKRPKRVSRRSRTSKRTQRTTLAEPADSGVKELPEAVVEVHSRTKGVTVFVDGKKYQKNPLYAIELAGGLRLKMGAHRILFRNPGCEERSIDIRIKKEDLKRRRVLTFKCNLLPAILYVESRDNLQVIDATNNAYKGLGRTNSSIPIRMTSTQKVLDLTIGPRKGKYLTRRVRLKAGARLALKLDK